jgi:hypothetical protein
MTQLTDILYRDTPRPTRSRSNTHTAHGYAERFNPPEEELEPEAPRMTIPRLSSRNISPAHSASPGGYARPGIGGRNSTFNGDSRSQRELSPAPRLSRIPTEPTAVLAQRAGLRPVRQNNTFADEYSDDYAGSNGYRRDRSPSPSTSLGSELSRSASWTAPELAATGSIKKGPPPPPPSRSKKPPPPPPMKRSALSSSETSHY